MLGSLIRWALVRLSGFKPMTDETYALILAAIEEDGRAIDGGQR